MSLFIIIKLLLLGFALVSWLIYQSRRSDNKDALGQLRATPVLRTLGAEETLALQPLHIANGLVWDNEVRALRGVYARHGFSVNGSETLHDTLGGVEVLLPYDATAFLQEHNDAEVVLTAKQAIVIRLNDFSVVEGRTRSLQGRTADLDPGVLQRPPPVPLAAFSGTGSDAAGTPVPAAPGMAESPVDVLGERQESAEETALRQPARRGLLAAGLWLIAFGLMWVAARGDVAGARLPLLVLALPAVAAALWLQWRPARPTLKAGRVKQLRGQLRLLELPNPVNAALRSQRYFLGDTQALQMPAHWQRSGRLPLTRTVQMDVQADSGEVLAIGTGWSQGEEQRRFPQVHWGRHLVVLLAALLGLLIAALSSNGLGQDLSLAWHGLRSGETRSDGTAATLLQRPPRAGDRLAVRGEGQCELALTALSDTGSRIVLPDCSRVRWGGQAAALPDVQLPPALLSLYHGSFIKARDDNMAQLMQQMQRMLMQQDSDPYTQALLDTRRSSKRVSGLGGMVDVVEQACAAGVQDCEGLQRELMRALDISVAIDGKDVALDTWPLLARELRRLAAEGSDSTQMDSITLGSVQDIARRHAGAAIAQLLQQLSPQLLSLQHGGVVLVTPQDLRGGRDGDHDDAAPSSGDVLERWQQSMELLAAPLPFTVEGLVLDSQRDAGGLRLQVDTHAGEGHVIAAAANSLWLILALLLALSQALLLVRGLLQARRRRQALDADLLARPAPGGVD